MKPDTGWGADQLSLSYNGKVALDRVSIWAAPGAVTAVVGGDGAGKTSLLRCLARALRPSSGRVQVPDRAQIGYLPARSGIYPDLTVAENLSFRADAYHLPAATAAARTSELLERAGLADARHRLGGQLSGGMRQKLGVIAALLPDPELLILDEPSTGVDPVSRSDLWWLIASAAASGAAVILSTTYLDDAARASTVVVLDGGQAIAAGRPEEITAAMPGTLTSLPGVPSAPAAVRRAWRRGTSWRLWTPPADGPMAAGQQAEGEPVQPDLQDAVTVAVLARELAAAARSASGPAARSESAAERPPASAGRAVATPARDRRGGPLAEARAVTCRFGDVTAVRDVSISVQPGEIVGLLGANGAGKTTLIRLLLGLVPATAGTALLLGEPPGRATRQHVGYVPQGLGLYDDLTPAENMEFAAAVFGTPGAARSAAEFSDLTEPVGSLPLGLQRRVAFAQALAHQPDLLILDEPTSGVDPLGRARLWQTIAAAVRSGAGALVSTHYLEEAGECDRLIVMADGAVVATGSEADIIGGMTVAVVDAADWADAFSRLERAGLPVALSGRQLRVPGATDAEVRSVLPPGTTVRRMPATLEERFFDLVQRPSGQAAA